MTKLITTEDKEIDAYRVYGIEERDANTVTILVRYPEIEDKYVMQRSLYNEQLPKIDDYLVTNGDGKYYFLSTEALSALTAPVEGPKADAVDAGLSSIEEPVTAVPVSSEPLPSGAASASGTAE